MHFYDDFFRASGEAITGTLRYLDMHFYDEFVRASVEAILRYTKIFGHAFLR